MTESNWLRGRRIHQSINKKSSASDKPENGTARGWLIENPKSKIKNRKSKIENPKLIDLLKVSLK